VLSQSTIRRVTLVGAVAPTGGWDKRMCVFTTCRGGENVNRSKRLFGLAVTTALILALFPAGLSFAQVPGDAETVDTNAVVNPSGSPPNVRYKFELPDMQSGVAGIQYGTVANPHQHDDDMNVPGMDVAPNLEDLPEKRLIEYWWVAEDPNGIGDLNDAFIRVWHPDGSLKYQLHGVLVPCTSLAAALEAAVHTGQITQADADLIVEECGKNVLRVYRVVGDLSKHQPCGLYTVEAQAVDGAGNTDPTPAVNNFNVLCVIGFEKDFDPAVDFGEILPNTVKWVRGDKDMNTPLRPSVKNTGNTAMYLWLHFGAMIGQNFQKVINQFDAQLNSQAIDPIFASENHCFDLEPFGSNEIKQLDLSIHPGSIPADTYAGWLDVWGRTSCTP
jgi:hypothetical protein